MPATGNAPRPADPNEGQASSSQTVLSAIDWAVLVNQIRTGEDVGMERLYKLFSRGIRYYLCRRLGPQELDDKVHDAFLIVVNAIRRGDLREPERLMGFVRTVVRRRVVAHIDSAVRTRREETDLDAGIIVADRKQNPEQEMMIKEKAELMKSSLAALSQKDREILIRFYIKEQEPGQICGEMGLTETQFRLTKSRAKAKFGEIGRRKLTAKAIFSAFVRK